MKYIVQHSDDIIDAISVQEKFINHRKLRDVPEIRFKHNVYIVENNSRLRKKTYYVKIILEK